MSRIRVFLISGLVALGGLAAAAPVVSAQEQTQENASCPGVLSSVGGPLQLRDDFAPAPGEEVSGRAQQKGDFEFCFSLLPG
jgi:hypothetical protein